jgi:DNA polymerase II
MEKPANKLTLQKGFLLTRQSYDHQGKAIIHLWLSTAKGPAKLYISNEQPVFFIAQTDIQKAEVSLKPLHNHYSHKPLGLYTFSQDIVSGLYFNNLRAFYDARTILEEAGISFNEGNIRLEDRYLMERFVYGSVEFIGEESSLTEQAKKGYIEYRNIRVKPGDYVPDFKMLSLDIECSEKGELYSIGFYTGVKEEGVSSCFKRVIMIQPEPLSDEEVSSAYIQWVKNEVELLQTLEQTIQYSDPDIIIGWNIINFDFRLLAMRAALHNLKLRLGRDHSYMRWRDSRTEKNQGFVSIDGRVVIDGIAALKAEAYSFPSFSLEAIGQHFLGRGKAIDDVEDRLDTINNDFKYNKVKLAEYNLQDCILVWDIFAKIKLMDYLIFRSQLTGLELDKAGGSVAAFVNLYLPKLHRQGYVSPNLSEGGGLASPGGYVMNSKPGLYNNVLVLDFKSLYPSIIRTFKIDPLGLIEGQKDPDHAIKGFRGGCFSREKHLLPEIITELWKKRDQAKKDQDKARSQAIKIIMNSFYGVLGSGGCPFYDTKLASSITLRGHEIMQQTANWIEEEGLDVIYGDTDSTFVLLNEGVTNKEANDMGKSLAETINKNWQTKLTKEHQIDSFLEIEFESHFSKFLMPTIRGSKHGSKKRYAGLLKQGNEEKLIFKGLESVRTDWTVLAKDFQLKLYEMIFHGENPVDYIVETVHQTLSGERDSELIYRKRLRRNLHSYVKNVPPHVKAARIADAQNLKLGKSLKHQNKGWISYIMTINGPQPVDYISANIDYQFYVDRQIEPVADGILPFIGLSFKNIVDQQIELF